jgi:hypothetical protein
MQSEKPFDRAASLRAPFWPTWKERTEGDSGATFAIRLTSSIDQAKGVTATLKQAESIVIRRRDQYHSQWSPLIIVGVLLPWYSMKRYVSRLVGQSF